MRETERVVSLAQAYWTPVAESSRGQVESWLHACRHRVGKASTGKNKATWINLRICSRESVVFGDGAGGCGCTLTDAQEGLR